MKRLLVIAIALLCLAGMVSIAVADEGMWLFNLPPTEQVKAKYGFTLTKQWLDHVRLSSVRFNNGGSGSFVSPDGLTMTNHHVGATCIHQLSTEGKDYMKTGFYARTQAEEAKCPDLELNVLQEIEDVTAKVNAGREAGDVGGRPGAGATGGDVGGRAGLRDGREYALRRGDAVFRGDVSPLQVQEVYGRAAGVRAGVRRRRFSAAIRTISNSHGTTWT